MGCRIFIGHEQGTDIEQAIFFCSTTNTPLSVFMRSEEEAEDFLKWLSKDPRTYTDYELQDLYYKYYNELQEKEE